MTINVTPKIVLLQKEVELELLLLQGHRCVFLW